MFFRKRKVNENQKWKIYQYKQAIERCYRQETVGLALCSSKKFVALNFRYGQGSQISERHEFVENSFEIYGVVHEFGSDERHVPCDIEVYETERVDDRVGYLVLTTTNWEALKKGRSKEEELDLFLQVQLFVTAQFRLCLFDGLRDAALSGFRFMHLGLGCKKSTDEDVTTAMAKIREEGCGPTRDILQLKLWPKVELQNSPAWARAKKIDSA